MLCRAHRDETSSVDVDDYLVDPSPASFLLINVSRLEVDWNIEWAKQSHFDMSQLIVLLLVGMVKCIFIL